MKILPQYLNPTLFHWLEATTCSQALEELVSFACENNLVEDSQDFLEALNIREKQVSTGIGKGIAIPHAKLANLQQLFVIFAISKEGIPWKSQDGEPVHIMCLIGSPISKDNDYLDLLSELSAKLRNEEKRKQIFNLTSANEIIKILLNE